MAGADTGGDVVKAVPSAACDGAVEGSPKMMGRESRGTAGILDPVAPENGDGEARFAPGEQLAQGVAAEEAGLAPGKPVVTCWPAMVQQTMLKLLPSRGQ